MSIDRTAYDTTYLEALKSDNPIEFIDNRWGSPLPYFNEFLLPILKKNNIKNAIEIGAGFGRYSRHTTQYCQTIYGIEVSELCVDFLRDNFNKITPIKTTNLNEIESADLLYSFSTMLHFNLYEIWWYLKKLIPKLTQGSYIVIHYSSFESAGGVDLFVSQPCNNFGEVGRYIFHHSTQLIALGKKLGLVFVEDKTPDKCIVKGHRVIVLQKGIK